MAGTENRLPIYRTDGLVVRAGPEVKPLTQRTLEQYFELAPRDRPDSVA